MLVQYNMKSVSIWGFCEIVTSYNYLIYLKWLKITHKLENLSLINLRPNFTNLIVETLISFPITVINSADEND